MSSTNLTAKAFRERYQSDPEFRALKLARNRAYNKAHPEVVRAAVARYRNRAHPPKPLITDGDRFWSKVEKSDGCWIWTAARNRAGYGKFYCRGAMRTATRVLWELITGTAVPDELFVCHRCDNPPCVRPDHLFLGTNTQNQVDRQSRIPVSRAARS